MSTGADMEICPRYIVGAGGEAQCKMVRRA